MSSRVRWRTRSVRVCQRASTASGDFTWRGWEIKGTMLRIPIPASVMSIDSPDTTYDRRKFMAYFGALGLSTTLLPGVLWAQANQQQGTTITKEMVAAAE